MAVLLISNPHLVDHRVHPCHHNPWGPVLLWNKGQSKFVGFKQGRSQDTAVAAMQSTAYMRGMLTTYLS
jgi:hypothetical protein